MYHTPYILKGFMIRTRMASSQEKVINNNLTTYDF